MTFTCLLFENVNLKIPVQYQIQWNVSIMLQCSFEETLYDCLSIEWWAWARGQLISPPPPPQRPEQPLIWKFFPQSQWNMDLFEYRSGSEVTFTPHHGVINVIRTLLIFICSSRQNKTAHNLILFKLFLNNGEYLMSWFIIFMVYHQKYATETFK